MRVNAQLALKPESVVFLRSPCSFAEVLPRDHSDEVSGRKIELRLNSRDISEVRCDESVRTVCLQMLEDCVGSVADRAAILSALCFMGSVTTVIGTKS